MSRSDEPAWWSSIDKKAAMREQFPPLSKVRSERPGCRQDIERKRVFREAAELKRVREHEARWAASCEENARRQADAVRRAENAAYRRRQRAMREAVA
jgi:hypothetical protein